MKNLVKKNIKGNKVLLLFILTSIFYAVMLIVTIPKVMSFSGGMKLLDMMPTGYSVEYVNALLNALGEEGRSAYLFSQIPMDMIYPFLFGISYCLILAYFLEKIGKLESSLFNICYFPLIAGLLDYCENIGIILILNRFPTNSNLLTETTNVFSILKSLFTTVSLTALVVLFAVFVIRKLFLKQNTGK